MEDRENIREFLCDGAWDSWLNDDDDDGFFELHIDGSGNITGWHTLPNRDRIEVTGTCEHSSSHRIELEETRAGVHYLYTARIIPKSTGKHKTKNGRCKITRKRRADDEVWVGVKTT